MCPFQNSYMGCCKVVERFQTRYLQADFLLSNSGSMPLSSAVFVRIYALYSRAHHYCSSNRSPFTELPLYLSNKHSEVSYVSSSDIELVFTSLYPLLMVKRSSAASYLQRGREKKVKILQELFNEDKIRKKLQDSTKRTTAFP
jgi:hypothetical protein